AARAFDQGRYADALAALTKAPAEGPEAVRARLLASKVLEETGRLAEALESARLAASLDPGVDTAVRVGRLQAATGDLEGAESTLRDAAARAANRIAPIEALGELLRSRGRRKEALACFLRANDAWASAALDDTEEILAAVRARLAIFELDLEVQGQRNATLEMLAAPAKSGSAEAMVILASVFVKDDETQRVARVLRPLLTRNPLHAQALAVSALSREKRFEWGEAADLARRALATDPSNPVAAEVLAILRYGDDDRPGAEAVVKKALALRPRDRTLLALDAIPRYLDGGAEAFAKAMEPALAVDPSFGRGWAFLARVMEDRRRFAEAAAAARRAVEIDPADADAWFALARNELNLGHEKEALAALKKSDDADAWRSRFRNNFLEVLDELDGYSEGKTANFRVLLHPNEDAALRGLYEKALESSLADLRKSYGFDPEVPLLIEIFRNAEDFSARTLGIPGFAAVGACFGRVVTLDSPSALPAGSFCWRSTLHHELAHVFHLQMTEGQVPRWFTEGLSVHEEALARVSWVRNMDRQLVSAVANGEVRGVLHIDSAFRGDVAWAYYQSGMMLGWIERQFGREKVLAMLRAYADGADNERAVRDGLGIGVKEFDAGFLDHCKRLTGAWKVRPRWSDARLAEFRRRSEKDPKDAEAHLHLAEACLQRGNTVDAGTALARARAGGVPEEDGFFTLLRARLAHATLKSPERALDLMRSALDRGWDEFDLRVALAADAEAEGREEEAVGHLRRAIVHFPRDPAPRRTLSRILTGLGRPDEAQAELESIAAMGESEIDARLMLADLNEARGNAAAAARVLAEIVDICPVPGFREKNDRRPAFPAADVHARLGRALVKLERPGDAAGSFALAAAVGRGYEPRQPPETIAGFLVEQAKAAHAAGREEEARRALRDAVRTDPGNSEAPALLKMLEK
ncbi:MAG TPA: tetratricopeptide repeat protein, partial [Planctomycetota bacterium]|nr:tetratricopeptide repeat protein [Planctomycetota bacterium]